MLLLHKILDCLIKGDDSVCALCYSTQNDIYLQNEIVVESDKGKFSATFSNIIETVLGDNIRSYISSFEGICENCAQSLTAAYTFIRKCYKNTEYFVKVLDILNNVVKDDYNDGNCKSLFVSITDLENSTLQYLMDDVKVSSKSEALYRFQILNSSIVKSDKIKTRHTKDNNSQNVKVLSKTHLKTSDMLLDPNNSLVKCKVCFKIFTKKLNLRQHFLKEHAPKTFKCSKCKELFGSKTILNIHIKHKHSEAMCSECGDCFQNEVTFMKHKLKHSSNYPSFACPDCGRNYRNRGSYNNHIKLNLCKPNHNNSSYCGKYKCDYCNKEYSQKMSLRVHIQYEHGDYKGHICEWCGKKFWAQSRLKAHVVKHTRERNFTCSICNRKFVTKESLLYHTRLHTGEKPYKCTECGCQFLSASRRAYHLKMYHKNAVVECDICNSKFSSKMYMGKHKKKCHKQTDGIQDGADKSFMKPDVKREELNPK